jgi:hypothetical protein
MPHRQIGRSVTFAQSEPCDAPPSSPFELRLYRALAAAAAEFAAAVDVEDLLTSALILLCRTLSLPYGRVHWSLADRGVPLPAQITYHREAAPPPPFDVPAAMLFPDQLQKSLRAIIIEDVLRQPQLRRRLRCKQPTSLIMVPLLEGRQLRAVYEVYGPAAAYHPDLLRPLELFAAQVGNRLSVLRLEQDARRLQQELAAAAQRLQHVSGIPALLTDQRITAVPSRLLSARTLLLLADGLDQELVDQLRGELAGLAEGLDLLYRVIRRVRELPQSPSPAAAVTVQEGRGC